LKPEFISDGIRLPVFAIVYGILANARLIKLAMYCFLAGRSPSMQAFSSGAQPAPGSRL
jgi:hypothetical protein